MAAARVPERAEGEGGSLNVADIHMHVVPGVDDGAGSMEEALRLLELSAAQGVRAVFATPHGSAFRSGPERVRERFLRLRAAAAARGLPVRLFFGCELRLFPDTAEACTEALLAGRYPTMNGTRFVLTEFDPEGFTAEDAAFCVRTLRGAGFLPIVAHAERCRFTTADSAAALKDLGARIQINAYSVVNESKGWIRENAAALLSGGLADFIGTDAHRMDHRPPAAAEGIAALRRLYGEDYARQLCEENPQKLLIAPGAPEESAPLA